MSKYHIELYETPETFLWVVIEDYTQLNIRVYDVEEDANDYMKFVNNGGAFGPMGHTPKYLVEDLNNFD